MDVDFASLMVPVVRRVRGDPNKNLSTKEEWRWGNKGSFVVKLKQGVWYDHENNEGGGVLDFVRRYCNDANPWGWLREQRFIEGDPIIATFDYRDEAGKLLYQVCRTANKRFWQRRPNGSGWINSVKGTRLVPYHLPELLASTAIVFIPEGEKHCDALIKLGLCATCNVGGAGKWSKKYNEFLRGRDVVILPDNDKAGIDHGEKVARNLAGVALRVRVLMLPDLKPKGDIINWLGAGGTIEQLLQLAEDTATWEESQPGSPEDGGNYEPSKKSQAIMLIELAQAAQLFHTSDRTSYADVPNEGHRETWSVRSKDFKLWLGRALYRTTGKTAQKDQVSAALDQIEAQALWESPEHPVYIRNGGLNGKIYLDLCDDRWRAIEIDVNGWRAVDKPPIRFRRAPGMLSLPLPVRGGSIDDLRPFLNLRSDDDFVLAVAWLLAALRERGPYPILGLNGEQGSAKTFSCTCLRSLIDPNVTALRALPRDELSLYIAALNGYVIAFDNVSGLPYWLSDALSRLSTGGGLSTRKYYTDNEERLFTAKRPTILNGIDDNISRGDLADRSMVLTLDPIIEDERRVEQELQAEFEQARPKILGALLDAIVGGLKELPETKLARVPRMADFALWMAACENGLWELGTFERAYAENRGSLTETVLAGMPVAVVLRDYLSGLGERERGKVKLAKGEWLGTASELLNELNLFDNQKRDRHTWPQTPKSLSDHLRRAAPLLRKNEVEIVFHKSGDRHIEIKSGVFPNPGAAGAGHIEDPPF